MRRGFWASLFPIIGLAILFSIPATGYGVAWGNPEIQVYGNMPVRNGDRVTITGSGFESGELLTGFGAVVNIQNEEPAIYRGFNLPLEVTTNASGQFSASVSLDMFTGIRGKVELALYYNGKVIPSEFLPVSDSGIYRPDPMDATAGTLIFGAFGHGGSGEDPVVNTDDVPLSSNSGGDWDGTLFQVNLERYTTTDGTGTSSPVNSITNDVAFTGTSPNLDLTAGSSAIVEQLSASHKSVRMTVLVWDDGSYPSITGTTTTGSTQGTGYLSSADVTAPTVQSAQATSLTTIVVTFSEAVTTPALNADAINNWTITYSGNKAVSALTPLGSSSTTTVTLTVADLGDRGATPTVQFTTGTNEFEDSAGNDCASTTSPHITASDGIDPAVPTLDTPTGATFMTGASVNWTASAGAGADASLAGIRFQGSDNGSSWTTEGTDTSSPYGATYTFGTAYVYYRAQAYDNQANTANSSSTENLQDAHHIDLTIVPSSVPVNTESGQWEFAIEDNYGNTESVTQTIGLSTESTGGQFRATSGGSPVGSIDLNNASTGNFYYIDSDLGTWEIKVNNASYFPDSTDFQITAGAASKILIKLPGQTFSSGNGISGTPDFSGYGGNGIWAKAGNAFGMTLLIVDNNNNLVTETGTRDVDFVTTAGDAPDGTGPTLNTNPYPLSNVSVTFDNGFSTSDLASRFYDFTEDYSSVDITASDNSGSPTLTGATSTRFYVLFEDANHIDWVNSGGTPTSTPVNATQTAGAALPTFYIGALDAYNNVDTTYTSSTITTTGGSSTPPTNSPSGTGQGGANAPNGNTAPDYGTTSTWSSGIVTLSNGTTLEETTIFDATATGFRIRGLASGGGLTGLYTSNSDQFNVDCTVANYLRIEDTSGGGGTEYVDGETFNTGQSITFWSISYDTYGNTYGNHVATWSSTVISPSASGTSTNWTFNPDATATGGTLTAANGGLTNRTISNITVTADATVASVIIRDATGGGGSEVTTQEVAGAANGANYNRTDYMYCAGYNADEIYVNDVTATWSVSDLTGGSFETGGATTSNRYIASSVTNQTGYVYVTYSTFTDSTGLLTIDATEPATPQSFDISEDQNQYYVNATWDNTSSYDDGSSAVSGNVSDMEIRWADAQIDDETKWDAATSVGTSGEPQFNSASSWRIYMGGAPAGYHYYAVKTMDPQGYWSDMGTGCYTTASDYSLPVTLSSFQAKGGFGKIQVDWTTESEVDALGFVLLRDESAEFENPIVVASYESIPELLCQGSTVTGFDYSFVDKQEIVPEKLYHYRLEAVDINGRQEASEMETSATAMPLPTEYIVGPNFPNPFNPNTQFDIELPENSNVSVTIYDAAGREVAQIIDARKYEAGIHRLSWNGANQQGMPMPSGIYFCRLQAEGNQRIMKMLLLK